MRSKVLETIDKIQMSDCSTIVCIKCGEQIFESGSVSRCLRCGKATAKEVSGKDYYENKYKTEPNREE